MERRTFSITAAVWLYQGEGAWHFVTLPKNISEEIDHYYALSKRGWGSLPVKVVLGETTWETSIFPDKKSGSCILPLKAMVRKNESIKAGETVTFNLMVKE